VLESGREWRSRNLVQLPEPIQGGSADGGLLMVQRFDKGWHSLGTHRHQCIGRVLDDLPVAIGEGLHKCADNLVLSTAQSQQGGSRRLTVVLTIGPQTVDQLVD
jgi:hypothetical protein